MKSSYVIFTIGLLGIIGCNDVKSRKQNSPPLKDSTKLTFKEINNELINYDEALRDSIWQNKEYLDFDSLTINGELPLITDTLSLYNLLGRPHEVTSPNLDGICVSFYDTDFKYVIYNKSTSFELYGDTLVLQSINFRDSPNLYLKSSKLILNHRTTLKDIEKTYPKAVKFKSITNIHELGNLITVHLGVDKGIADAAWLLFFKEDRLIRIDYWMPC